MIEPKTIEFFKGLYWDYHISDEEIVTILETGECKGFTRKNLLGRVLKSRRWYEILEILPHGLLEEALSDDVLKTIFPKSLADKYYYVRELFYS
ncbi:MAG: hypothetical protein ISS19_04465 [Bacteroidales bacterium]|nr:hypothetical protein [Bacteroidales bacterium]